MGSEKGYKSEILNEVLRNMLKLLNDNNFDSWFVSYGTLLGIIRENSCIDLDDDIDILIDIKHRNKLVQILKENNYTINKYGRLTEDTKDIVKARQSGKPSVDFYFANIKDNGDYVDTWNDVIWTDCLPLQKKNWNDVVLYIPNNYEKKLIGRYGDDWNVPKGEGYKGPLQTDPSSKNKVGRNKII